MQLARSKIYIQQENNVHVNQNRPKQTNKETKKKVINQYFNEQRNASSTGQMDNYDTENVYVCVSVHVRVRVCVSARALACLLFLENV